MNAGVCAPRCAFARPAHFHWRDGSRAPFGHARRPCCGGAWDFCGGSSATLFPTLELCSSSAETRRLMRSLAFPWECWQSSAGHPIIFLLEDRYSPRRPIIFYRLARAADRAPTGSNLLRGERFRSRSLKRTRATQENFVLFSLENMGIPKRTSRSVEYQNEHPKTEKGGG